MTAWQIEDVLRAPIKGIDHAGLRRDNPALVVFMGSSDLRRLRLLRRGFRHCFVVVSTAGGWVICDPLSHQTDLDIVSGFSCHELAAWYRNAGMRVIETRVRAAPRQPAPLRPYTCVEAVKRILGLHAPWVITPWQLYRLLRKQPPVEIRLDTPAL